MIKYVINLDAVTKAREKSGLSMRAIHKESGIALSAVNRFCNDPDYQPMLGAMGAFADCIGMDVSDLFLRVTV